MTAPTRALELLERIQAVAERAGARLDAYPPYRARSVARAALAVIASDAAEVVALLTSAPPARGD